MEKSKKTSVDEFWPLYVRARCGHWKAKGFTLVESAAIALTEADARKSIWKHSNLGDAVFSDVSVDRDEEGILNVCLSHDGHIVSWPVVEHHA